MVRKIFICFFVLLLCTTIVVPAFASSSSGSGNFLYPSAVIDSIGFNDGSSVGSIVDWPNNFGRSTNSFTISSPAATFVCNRTSSLLNTEVYSGNCRSISLRLSNLFLLDGTEFLLSGGNDNVRFTRISFSGQYNLSSKDTSTEYYSIRSINFSAGSSLNRISSIDLVDQLAFEITGSHDPIFPNGVLWLQNVLITIDFEVLDSSDTAFLDFEVSTSNIQNPFVYWFNRNKFIYGTHVTEVVNFPGMFDWLLDSVQAFFEFEIAPGLPLNTCFYIVLVIGILIAFFKIFI